MPLAANNNGVLLMTEFGAPEGAKRTVGEAFTAHNQHVTFGAGVMGIGRRVAIAYPGTSCKRGGIGARPGDVCRLDRFSPSVQTMLRVLWDSGRWTETTIPIGSGATTATFVSYYGVSGASRPGPEREANEQLLTAADLSVCCPLRTILTSWVWCQHLG